MTFVRRLLLVLIVATAAVRAAAYLVYANALLRMPVEAFHLEAKMVLLAYRVQVGASLYPRWQDYPHVANFFGPVYFELVGLLGALVRADLPTLFSIGRALTFLSAMATTLIVWVVAARRYGRGAGVVAALLSLGAGTMIGFTVMVRPDAMADLLGLGGFLLAGQRSRWRRAVGGALLVLAILTKQTSALYLAAAVLADAFEGERRRALWLAATTALVLVGVIGLVNIFFEPNFIASLGGEAKSPWAITIAAGTAYETRFWPDVFLVPLVGLCLWIMPGSRDVRLATLAAVLLVGSAVAAGKQGASLNYYLGLRAVEGLAAGAAWTAARAAAGRARWAVLAVGVVVLTALLLGCGGGLAGATRAENQRGFFATARGRSYLRVYQALLDKARDPRARILTDSGMIDLYQGERAAFGDPWLFRLMVDTGRIDPVTMKSRIDDEYYELVITTSDIMLPAYADYAFGLPMVLAERVRAHYQPIGARAGHFLYERRAAQGSTGTRP